jgi:hypothetical protein
VHGFKLIKPPTAKVLLQGANPLTTQRTSKAQDKQENSLSMPKPPRKATKEDATHERWSHLLP